jgi:APA family basic amino acid/polyamine antiporter
VFVSIGVAAGLAGPAVVLAIAAAALVATCNALSSAELAANHPVSGGTYEYGYRWLTPSLGFTAGWMFLCAKTASAATAALGCAAYSLHVLGLEPQRLLIPIAVAIVLALTLVVLCGIRTSSATNAVIVTVTLLSLAVFVVAGAPAAVARGTDHLTPFFAPMLPGTSRWAGLLEATALMFVAYTGYGRIATLAEEVHKPRRTIPLAIIVTLVVSMVLYVAVGLVGVAAAGADTFADAGGTQAVPLEIVAGALDVRGVQMMVAIGAITAMLGVLLNLILGNSRVALAMARRREMPSALDKVSGSAATPYLAVIVIGVVIAALALTGNVKTTWSFSAFTVLVYYAITNLAATRLSNTERLYPRVVPWLGLATCLFLAFWVEKRVWLVGLGLIAAGLVWHLVARWALRRHSVAA